MRIVMLSCNTGEGHNSTAKAILEVLKQSGVECEILDVLSFLSPSFSKFVCSWHARLYKYAPKLWDVGYRVSEAKENRSEESTMLYELLTFGASNLRGKLEAGRYDAAICVHVFSGMMMTELRKTWNIAIPCYFVATDYACYPYVELCDMDGYIVPAEPLLREFAAAGIPRDKLIPIGIPVRQEFYSNQDKLAARKALELNPEGRVVLLMCGSMGCGPMRRIAVDLMRRLPNGTQVVAVCGRNEKLYDALAPLELPGLRVLGFTAQVGAYMDAADMVVTKPGGLSSTEAANKGLPMVFINSVGGCESRNFNYFLNRGYAIGSTDPETVIDLTVALAERPERLEYMSRALKHDFKRNSAVLLAELVMEAARNYRAGEKPPVCKVGERQNHSADVEKSCSVASGDTLANLASSFASESQLRTCYALYAQQARSEHLDMIAGAFAEIADNEAVHAEAFLKLLHNAGGSEHMSVTVDCAVKFGNTRENLTFASLGELELVEHTYPTYAETARREGFWEAASLWEKIAGIENSHHQRLMRLKHQLEDDALTMCPQAVVWKCLHCGYTYESERACDPCPVCQKAADWQKVTQPEKIFRKPE